MSNKRNKTTRKKELLKKRRKKNQRHRKDTLAGFSLEEVGRHIFDHKRLTTPSIIDDYVLKFCKQLSPEQQPIYLAVQPKPWSRLNYCNKNVERMIQLNNGEMVLGYKIWYVKSLYAEAERHAVWRNPEGQLKDISFNKDGEKRILFLPSPKLNTVVSDTLVKPRIAFHPQVEQFLKMYENNERMVQVVTDDSWTGWEQALSFESSLKGS